MIATAQWLRICMFSMEIPGLNDGKTFFMHLFYLAVTVLLEYFNPAIYNCLVFTL